MATKKAAAKKAAPQRILTDEQFTKLRDARIELGGVEDILEDLNGEDNKSTIMFKVGEAYARLQEAKNDIEEIEDSYDVWIDEDEDDNY